MPRHLVCPDSLGMRTGESRLNPVLARMPGKIFCWCIALILVLLLSEYAARRPVDFPVYYAAVRAMLTGNAPIYGPTSGVGWPQVYRYPPLFLLLFLPFALLPFRLAAILWAAPKFLILYFLTRALFTRLSLDGWLPRVLAVVPAIPYLALEFHYGNVQFYVFSLVALALLCLKKRPSLAALALALGISIKAWPLFFVPYCMALGYRRVVLWTMGIALAFTLIPTAFFGPLRYAGLLKAWGAQELGVAATPGEPGIIGFPSQSLHSVMMRYFVSLDYSKLPDPHYPKFNLTAVDSGAIEAAWVALSVAGYAALLFLASTQRKTDGLVIHAIAFCSYVLLQPFTQSGDLVVLLWPIVVAAALLHGSAKLPSGARTALWAALFLMTFKTLLPGAAMHRALEVLGLDFWLACLLTAGLLAANSVATPAIPARPLPAVPLPATDLHDASHPEI
jgi:hypothetical protein